MIADLIAILLLGGAVGVPVGAWLGWRRSKPKAAPPDPRVVLSEFGYWGCPRCGECLRIEDARRPSMYADIYAIKSVKFCKGAEDDCYDDLRSHFHVECRCGWSGLCAPRVDDA